MSALLLVLGVAMAWSVWSIGLAVIFSGIGWAVRGYAEGIEPDPVKAPKLSAARATVIREAWKPPNSLPTLPPEDSWDEVDPLDETRIDPATAIAEA